MAYLNKCMLIGNLGKDPEIRVNQASGRKVVSFSLATSRRYRDNNGEQKEQTDWHNIVGWGKVAEVFEQLGIRKGTTLYVEGRLTNRSWTDQASGQKRYVTEINMDTFQLLTPRNNGTQGNETRFFVPTGEDLANASLMRNSQSSIAPEDDIDLPF